MMVYKICSIKNMPVIFFSFPFLIFSPFTPPYSITYNRTNSLPLRLNHGCIALVEALLCVGGFAKRFTCLI